MLGMSSITQYKVLQTEINKVKEENKQLKEELEFYKRISEHPSAQVANMYVKELNGEKVWINRNEIVNDKNTLFQLKKDKDVLEWIQSLTIKYKDNDW